MNRPDVCDLITMVYAKDREGYETETEVVSTVFCNWQEGVSQNEFYLAHKEGFQASASVDIFSADYERELMARIPSCTSGRWHPAFTDITAQGADKGEGMLIMAKHFGLDPQYTMAFGDGGNDASMIRTAGIGVAMGNALDSLKKEAAFTTTSVDDDGILNALRHFGLL